MTRITRPHFLVYEAKDGFRWRFIAGNGRIMADSGEAYVSIHNAQRAVERLEELWANRLYRGDIKIKRSKPDAD